MQRLLRLLMLLSGKRKYTLQELSRRFEFSERTVYRYLDTIESSGFVLDRSGGAYRLAENTTTSKALEHLFHFTDEEAWMLYQLLDELKGDSTVKNRLVRKLHALYDFKALALLKGKNEDYIISKLSEAISSRKRVVLYEYRSSHSNRIADRRVEAFGFLPDYSAVWCFDAKDNCRKQFRISRIRDVEVLNEPWSAGQDHEPPFTDAFRMAANKPVARVEIRFNLKAFNLIIEEFPLANDYIRLEEGVYKMNIPVADFHGIGRFVLGLPGDIEVVSPPEFEDFLREKRKSFFRSDIRCQ